MVIRVQQHRGVPLVSRITKDIKEAINTPAVTLLVVREAVWTFIAWPFYTGIVTLRILGFVLYIVGFMVFSQQISSSPYDTAKLFWGYVFGIAVFGILFLVERDLTRIDPSNYSIRRDSCD